MARKSKTTPSNPINTGNTTENFDRKLARRDAKQLGLNKGYLPSSIKEVILTLTQAGFEAYIVGGGVRDALLGLEPKDFDAVTNATPTQIKEVFGKRCRIIGKRFLLCHVYSGRDLIEVATFRATPTGGNHTNEDGMILRDNVWGDIFADVVRRDFSINALYYQPFEGFVYDFCDGLTDIKNRTLRLLGDTKTRVEEDPVRLLRALRFKAKLNFKFDKQLEKQFNPQSWELLTHVSPHRLYDETQKMISGGYLNNLLPLLYDYKAFDALIFYPPTLMTPLVEQVAINTDKRVQSDKSTNPAFFYACLLWENYLYLLNKHKKKMGFNEAQQFASNLVMERQRARTAMPKFAEQFVKDIWLMQSRLAEPRKKNLLKLFESQNFRASFDFLLLREAVFAKNNALKNLMGEAVTLDDESTNGMGHWWAWFQTLNQKQRIQAVDEFDIEAVKSRFARAIKDFSDGMTTSENNLANVQKNTAKGKNLTAQQRQEKAQLQQLSLANQPNSEAEQTANYFENIQKMLEQRESIAKPKTANQPTKDTTKPHKVGNEQAQRLLQGVPAERKRRLPSSHLSILDKKRGLSEPEFQQAEATAQEKPKRKRSPRLPTQNDDKPTVKRTRKKAVKPTNDE